MPLRKSETLLENITYMGVMAAINILFVLLTTLVPYLLFLLVFVLPLSNCVVTLFCKKRYYPIYAVATVGLSMIVTMWNISDTFFYVIPSICTGFLFGFLIEKKIPSLIVIILTSILEVGLSYLFLPLTQLIAGVDLITFFATVFKVNTSPYLDILSLLFITFLSVTQMAFTYLVIREELPKLGKAVTPDFSFPYTASIINAGFLLLTLIFGFFYPPLCYFFLMFSFLTSIYQLIAIFTGKKKIMILFLAIGVVLGFFLFAGCYRYIAKPMGLSLLAIFPLMIIFISLCMNYLSKKDNNDTIKE